MKSYPSGDELIADIDSCRPGPQHVALWWLGQHSFIVKAGPTILYIDLFLMPLPERQIPPLLAPEQIRHATLFCGTHDHLDHIDRTAWPALAKSSPEARFVVPDLLRERLAEELAIDRERFVGLDDGTSVQLGNVQMTGVAAAHEMLDRDPASGRYPYLGYVFEANGRTWYHAGDTCWYEGLQTRLRKWSFDFMLLPINGRDAKRLSSGIIGNMTYQEAADLAGPLRPRLVIPTHYDMFAGNPGDPIGFREYMGVKYPDVPTHLCVHGERLLVGPAAS